MNPKESDDRELSRDVLKRIPKFLDRPTVLGIGEIGLNRVTRNEIATYTEQVELAIAHRQLILIHTPHLEDKLQGHAASRSTCCARYREIEPQRVMVDHAEEHTIEMILDHGFWAGLTLYPQTKISPQRAVDVIEKYGPERICVAGACDWGPSDPIAVPRFAMEMRRRHHPEALIQQVVFDNPVRFLSQSPKFKVHEPAQPSRRGSADGHCRLRVDPSGFFHLTYCTNIHAADGWDAVNANLQRFAPGAEAAAVAVRPRSASGCGCPRATRASCSKAIASTRSARSSTREGLYVALINGFPHGSFHRTAVKADVYAPDWRDDERVRYTLDLVDDPEPPAARRASTAASPRRRSRTSRGSRDADAAWPFIAQRRPRRRRAWCGAPAHAARYSPRHRARARLPDRDERRVPRVLRAAAAARTAGRCSRRRSGATSPTREAHLREHVRICFDCCHFAVEYEDPIAALDRVRAAGVQVGRVQLSSALKVTFPDDEAGCRALAERLRRFADSTYLHQVIERRDGDAPALSGSRRRARPPARRPPERSGAFTSTCRSSPPSTTASGRRRTTSGRCSTSPRRTRFARHFEIETYTWDVLPAGLKIDLLDSIGREYDWVLDSSNSGQLPAPSFQLPVELANRATPGNWQAGSWQLEASSWNWNLNAQNRRPERRRPDAVAARRRDARAVGVGARRRRRRASSRPSPPSPARRSPTTSPAATPTRTASSATAGIRARTRKSGSGSSRTCWCRGRRSGTRRAPRIRRLPARTCSGGSTCTRRRTTRSRRGRCIRPTAARSRTSTPRRRSSATSCRQRSERFRCSSSGARARGFDRPSGSRMRPGTSIASSTRR